MIIMIKFLFTYNLNENLKLLNPGMENSIEALKIILSQKKIMLKILFLYFMYNEKLYYIVS